MKREPRFDNMIKVLNRKKPDRPVLFELFLNSGLYETLAKMKFAEGNQNPQWNVIIAAFYEAGYDYASLLGSDFNFPAKAHESKKSISLNEGSLITNRAEFENYIWPDPSDYDYSRLDKCASALPDGMKIIIWGPGGVLENVTRLVGFDNLCYMIMEDPGLVSDIFEAVGSRLIKYYEICCRYETVGALISNDDWGFQSQTLFSPADLRKYVFPYHKKIAEAVHAANKPVILHSCGELVTVMDDIIDDMKYDAKHSFEDKILPIEEAFPKYHDRIALLGGIDLDFVCRETPENIEKRCRNMIEISDGCTGYALGTGNSVPSYVPIDNYFAILKAVRA